MARRKIIWTETAARQRRYIFEYWNENNESNAYSLKLLEQINKRLNTLNEFPNSGNKTNFRNTNVTSLGHFSLFYQINKTQIIVTGFWDNRQDPKKLLKFLER